MLSSNYVVGLVDGEGSFTVYIAKPKQRGGNDRKRRVRAEPKFYIKLIERDKPVLYELQKFFGCGQVYLQRDYRPNHQHCYRYEVSNRADLEGKIIPFFNAHPLKFPSKRSDFRLFRKIFLQIKRGKHLTADGLEELYTLKLKMH